MEPEFKVGDRFIIEVAEVYATTNQATGGRKAEEFIYRMRGNIPLMRTRHLRLLEKVVDE